MNWFKERPKANPNVQVIEMHPVQLGANIVEQEKHIIGTQLQLLQSEWTNADGDKMPVVDGKSREALVNDMVLRAINMGVEYNEV